MDTGRSANIAAIASANMGATVTVINFDDELHERVRKILDYNLSVCHPRGGEAIKQKCTHNKPMS